QRDFRVGARHRDAFGLVRQEIIVRRWVRVNKTVEPAGHATSSAVRLRICQQWLTKRSRGGQKTGGYPRSTGACPRPTGWATGRGQAPCYASPENLAFEPGGYQPLEEAGRVRFVPLH